MKATRKILSGRLWSIIAVTIIGFITNSCELENMDLSCDKCYDIKPTEGILAIMLSPLNVGDSIPVTIYKGKLQSGTIYLQDTLTEDYMDVWVPVGNFYTVLAEYKTDSTLIRAVDGDNVSVYLDQSNCSEACWRARDGKADCRLR